MTPAVRLRAAIGYENAAWRPGLPGTQARALLAHALEGVPEDLDDPRYVWALASLGRATAFTGDAERSRRLADLALGQARRLGDRQLLRHALETMMWQHARPDSVDGHLALATELTPLAREAQDWFALGTAAVFRCAIAYIHADRAAWTAAAADLELAVRGSGQPFIAFMRRSGDYAHAFLGGDFAAAARIAEDLLELGRSFGPDDTEGTYGLQMYMIRRETGGLEQVRPLLGVIRQSSGTWEPGLLALYTELGLAEEARDLLWQLLDRVDETAAVQSPWAQWTAVLVFLVEAALALGDVAAARRLRPLLAPYSGQQLIAGQFVAVFGPADAYLAALDSLLGDRDSAERLFAAALAQATGFGALIHRASTLTAWAAHLRARADADARERGRPDAATELRAEARRMAASTGQERLLRLLGPAGRRSGYRGRRTRQPGRPGRGRADAAGDRGAPAARRGKQQPGDRLPPQDHREHRGQPRAQHPAQDRRREPDPGRHAGRVPGLDLRSGLRPGTLSLGGRSLVAGPRPERGPATRRAAPRR